MESLREILHQSGTYRPKRGNEPLDLVAHERYRAELANKIPGNLPGLDCSKCLNRGYIHVVDEFGAIKVLDCECTVRRRNQRRLERSGLSDMVKRYTFDTWQTTERWQQKFKELAQQYVTKQEGWFLTFGQPGSGKTHLCTAICGEFLGEGLNTQYMLWRDVAVKAKALVNDADAYARIVEPLKTVRVLYIDDFFKVGMGKNPTEADANLAFEILNSRYNDSKKLTIISSERSMQEILNIDEATGSRIYEKSKGFRLDFSQKRNWRMK